jgi:hypothetical protein
MPTKYETLGSVLSTIKQNETTTKSYLLKKKSKLSFLPDQLSLQK